MVTRNGSIGNDEFVLLPDLLGGTTDYTYGDYGDDIFYAGVDHGIDYVYGGEGTDLLSINYAANIYWGPEEGLKLNVVPGRSTCRRFTQEYLFDTIYFTGIERYTVKGTDVADLINTYNHGSLGYTDIIFSYGGNDVIQTFLGADTIDGGDGDDRILTNDGNDTINGGNGNDSIEVSLVGGNSKIDGGTGIDTMVREVNLSSATTRLVFTDTGATQTTVSLADGTRIAGIEYFDWLITGSGSDVVTYTSDRSQVLRTGAGDDIITAGMGSDEINGGSGIDLLKLDYSRYYYAMGVTLQPFASYWLDNVWQEYSGDVVGYRNGGLADRTRFTRINRFDIKGTSHLDRLAGGVYDDRFAGNDGNDTLSGSLGVDTLLGGNGDDQLTGNEDSDILTGGGGGDRFIFDIDVPFNSVPNRSMGVDRITDFSTSADRIVLDKTTFTALSGVADGALPANFFASVATDAEAQTSSALITYNRTTGALFYNQNGEAAGLGTNGAQFATLNNLANLTAAQVLVRT